MPISLPMRIEGTITFSEPCIHLENGKQSMKESLMKKNKLKLAGYDPKKARLSKEESDFENEMNVSDYIERSPKSERMNIRLSNADLVMLRKLAAKLGMPYQTLIGSVIHRFVTNQLVDVEEAKKVFSPVPEKKRA